VVWSEILPHLREEWRKHGAGSLRQLAERDEHHEHDEQVIHQTMARLAEVMGPGHTITGVSVYNLAALIPAEDSVPNQVGTSEITSGVQSSGDMVA
jgi:hypothetical protein